MLDRKTFTEYYPFNKFNEKFIPLLHDAMRYEEKPRGSVLFEANEEQSDAYYLIRGRLLCEYPDGRQRVIKADSLQSRYPVGDLNLLKRFRVSVDSPSVQLMRMNSTLIDHFTVWNSVYENSPPESPLRGHRDYRWVLGLLDSVVVRMLPRGHVQELFEELESQPVKNGDEVVSEGAPGDYCYVIAEGTASVFKCGGDGESQVADLGPGDLFGENALVGQEPRNASVRMSSDGVLMRLEGRRFRDLLKSHVVRWVTPQDVMAMLSEGAQLIDVRPPGELDSLACLNIPLEQIREEVHRLSSAAPIITCCDDGQRSASAAYILATLGFNVYALQGGVRGLLRLL